MNNNPNPQNLPATSTVQRAFHVLNTFDSDRRRQTLSEIARRSELPIATTYRMLQSLETVGAVERDEIGRYAVGITVWRQGMLAPVHDLIGQGLRPQFLRLATTFSVIARAFVLHNQEALCIEEVLPNGGNRPEVGLGASLPLRSSAPGIVLLSAIQSDESKDQEDTEMPKYQNEAIKKVLAYGHITASYADGSSEIAVPIKALGRPPMALSIRTLKKNSKEISWRDAESHLTYASSHLSKALALHFNEDSV